VIVHYIHSFEHFYILLFYYLYNNLLHKTVVKWGNK